MVDGDGANDGDPIVPSTNHRHHENNVIADRPGISSHDENEDHTRDGLFRSTSPSSFSSEPSFFVRRNWIGHLQSIMFSNATSRRPSRPWGGQYNCNNNNNNSRNESLLDKSINDHDQDNQQRQEIHRKRRSAMIAACFLKDYEEGRSPTFLRFPYSRRPSTGIPSEPSSTSQQITTTVESITDRQLRIYWFQVSKLWQYLGLGIATLCLFFGHLPSKGIYTVLIHLYAFIIFTTDWFLTKQLENSTGLSSTWRYHTQTESDRQHVGTQSESANNITKTAADPSHSAPLSSTLNHDHDAALRLDTSYSFDTSKSSASSFSTISGLGKRRLDNDEKRNSKPYNDQIGTISRLESIIRDRGMPLFLGCFFIEIWTAFLSSLLRTSNQREENLYYGMEDDGDNMDQQQDNSYYYYSSSSSTALSSPPRLLFQVIFTVSGLLKPMVFFYMSRKARDALAALSRIIKKLVRVIVVEFFLILTFAAVACRLYSKSQQNEKQQNNDYYQDQSPFDNLASSWLWMFTLSTTVVNPSLWMPAYNESRWNAVFFALFIVVAIFYLHSLVLSVIFQVFVQSAQSVHKQLLLDRERSMRMAFLALHDGSPSNPSTWNSKESSMRTKKLIYVDPELIYEMLKLLRPHYGRLKLKVLMNTTILDHAHHLDEPSWHDGQKQRGTAGGFYNEGFHESHPVGASASTSSSYHFLDYGEFRRRVTDGLNSSIRISRAHSSVGLTIEVVSAVVAVINFLYVVLLTSQFDGRWFVESEFAVGSMLTLLSLFEVLMRYNPLRVQHYPLTRLNGVLDGAALAGALVSLVGIAMYLGDSVRGLEILFTGRAIGMIQSMRFSLWGREVVQRSISVLPAMTGPILLVLTTMHVFVCIGMFLWQGSVDPGEMAQNDNIEYLFWLNNFNSYSEGLVTVLNVMVINDWHQIANVFLYADRFSSPIIVYGYFIAVVVVAVSVMLNLIVVFFCETFVSQLNLVDFGDDGPPSFSRNPDPCVRVPPTPNVEDFVSKTMTPLAKSFTSSLRFDSNDLKRTDITTTVCDETSQEVQFDVIRKEGYDEMMKAVANTTDYRQEDLALNLRDTLELTTISGEVEYMVFVHDTGRQFPTSNFRMLVKDYVTANELIDLTSIASDSLGLNDVVTTPLKSRRLSGRRHAATSRQVFQNRGRPSSECVIEVTATVVPNEARLILITAKEMKRGIGKIDL